MCGRFGLFARRNVIEDRFSATFQFDYEPRYNIPPAGAGIAAIKNETPTAINRVMWGFAPHWVRDPDDWPHPINARAESIDSSPTFRDSFEHRRCLIPANGFFEWSGERGNRVPYWVTTDDGSLFAMAGVWDTREEVDSVAIITTDANRSIDRVHDRMPVILDESEEADWLSGDGIDRLRAILDSFPADRTHLVEVSRTVNDPTKEGPELVHPTAGDQTGLDDFGA